MEINYIIYLYVILYNIPIGKTTGTRQKRYLLFTPSTQWGVFATVSIPLHPETTVSVAWFFEANYYNVANATYFEPLLGDITLSRKQEKRSVSSGNDLLTRSSLYLFIEAMIQKSGYAGQACLLRAICESASHDRSGVVADLLHLVLTPSTSLEEEDLPDSYYEAEYYGMEYDCEKYTFDCPKNPMDYVSVEVEKMN